jgi:type I restriction enzyme R subunit
MNEAYTCRTYVLPKLTAAGWDKSPHGITEQRTFTRIMLKSDRFAFAPPKDAAQTLVCQAWHTLKG